MKSRVKKRVIALMLCMVMVLSSGISTLAEGDAGTPEATEEVSSTNDESAVNTEPDTAVAEESQSRSNTAVETETAAEENAPAEAEAQPKTAEAAPAENTEADTAQQSKTATMGEGGAETQSAEQNGEEAQINANAARAPWDSIQTIEPSYYGSYVNISESEWHDLIESSDIDTATETNVPITGWTRSDPNAPYNRYKLNMDKRNGDWTWSDIEENLGNLSITDPSEVWDGSRNTTHYYTDYLANNQVTVYDEKLYDSATWSYKRDQRYGDEGTSMYRFQGVVDLTKLEGEIDDYAFTLSQVTGSDRIYINDNVFVFVYPEGTTLTDDNFTNYLAFWTGTIQDDDNASNPTVFQGVNAAAAVQSSNTDGSAGAFGKLTNNWSMEAVEDNIGGFLNAGKTKYIIDVIVDDYSAGGGMYRLQLNKKPVVKTAVTLLKVDENDQSIALPGATFEVTGIGNSYRATGTTNQDGLYTFNLIDGEYTLREIDSPDGYLDNDTVWTITVQNGQCTIRQNGGDNLTKNSDGQFIITNEKDVTAITGDLTFTKTNADGTANLPGAQFTLYESDGTTTVGTGTSDQNGVVTISDIPYGSGYILKETAAPVVDGVNYVLSEDSWTVDVDEQGNVTMYLSTDSDQTSVSVIPNYTESEELLKGLENKKTVTSEDEANRVFKVLLNAYSTGSTTTGSMSDIDVMFVLDKSPSMSSDFYGNADRKDWLDAAVRSFISQLVEYKRDGQLTDSRVAIVEFDDDGSNRTNGWISDIESLERYSNNYSLTTWNVSGTSMRAGLQTAFDNYYNNGNYNSSNKQIIITLTDGENNSGAGWIDREYYNNNDNAALRYAEKIRAKVPGITLYGIGLGIDEYSGARTFMSNLIADASKLWFVSDNEGGEKLSQVFSDIFQSSTETDVYKNAKVIDYIDSRFQYSYTENGEWKVYTDEYIQDYQATNDGAGIELDNGGVLKYDTEKKCQYIEWTQDIGAKETEDEFTKNFYIKAKEDFIGGNMVPTNGPESGVYLDDTTIKYFPQPSVNVAPLSLELTGKEITVYKGDSIDPAEFISELTSSLKVTELDGQTKVTAGIPTIPALTDEQKAALATGNEVVIGQSGANEYVYPGTIDPIGYFKYTYKVEERPAINLSKHEMTVSGEDVAVYSLEIQFVPYSVAERDALEELGADVQQPATNGGTELVLTDPTTGDKLTADAKYVVDVISGEIQITKELKENASSDQSFTFKITKDEIEFATIVIDINEGGKTATYEGDQLEDLPRGTYVVTEEMQGYAVTNIVIGADTNCYHSDLNIEQGTVTFHLGQDKEDDNVINEELKHIGGGVLGTVTYTNDQAVSSWQIIKRSESNHTNYLEGAVFKLDSEEDPYYGMSNESGIIEWFVKNPMDSDFDKETDKLETGIPKGTYQFSELRAPSGYAVSGETWEIEFASLGKISSIISSKDQDKNMVDDVLNGGQTAIFYFDNEMLYELPESGGSGIYWYMLGGVLLMMAGSLLVYKKRRGEVLRRK